MHCQLSSGAERRWWTADNMLPGQRHHAHHGCGVFDLPKGSKYPCSTIGRKVRRYEALSGPGVYQTGTCTVWARERLKQLKVSFSTAVFLGSSGSAGDSVASKASQACKCRCPGIDAAWLLKLYCSESRTTDSLPVSELTHDFGFRIGSPQIRLQLK